MCVHVCVINVEAMCVVCEEGRFNQCHGDELMYV